MPTKTNTKKVRQKWLQLKALNLRYSWGGRRSNSFKGENGKRGVDCSGCIADILSDIPELKGKLDGTSIDQIQAIEEAGFERVLYSQARKEYEANSIYVAFFNNGGRGRHIWAIQNGRTLESYSPDGTESRDASTEVLAHNVQKCFKLS